MNDIEHIRYLRKSARALKFSFPENFKRCSSKRLSAYYNGVGAGWMPDWMRKTLTFMCRRLEAPALIHDFEFVCGKKSFMNFTSANLRLAYNAAKSRRPFTGIISALICQIFGWSAYKNGKELLTNGTP